MRLIIFKFQPWISKRSRVPVPIELLAIVIGTLVSKFGGLKEKFGISLVGNIPTGYDFISHFVLHHIISNTRYNNYT